MARKKKVRTPNGQPIPSVHTMLEMLAGRLSLRYQQDPAGCYREVQRLIDYCRLKDGDTMRKTYCIELKIDFDNPALHKTMLHICRKNARLLLTQATLIADNRQPQVGITCDDFFEGGTKEALMELGDSPEDAGDGIVGEDN